MEAMTQEFMLHRRPHVEIWSAREGSDDDNASRLHFRNKKSDGSKTMSTKNKGSISETKSLVDPNQQTMVNLRYHKTERKNQTIQRRLLQQQVVDSIQQSSTSPHVHLGPHQRYQTPTQQQTADSIYHTSEDQNKTCTKHRCSSLDPITHPIRNRRLRQILIARILRRQKSRRRNGKP